MCGKACFLKYLIGHFHTTTLRRHVFLLWKHILSGVVGVKFLSVFLPLNLSSIYKAPLNDVYSWGISLTREFYMNTINKKAPRGMGQGVPSGFLYILTLSKCSPFQRRKRRDKVAKYVSRFIFLLVSSWYNTFWEWKKEVNSSFLICICKWKGVSFTMEGTGLSHMEQTTRRDSV